MSGDLAARRRTLVERCSVHPDDIDGVLVAPGLNHEAFVAHDYRRRQPLRGFEDIYADIVHYIMRCTHRIWEEDGGSGTHLLHTHYSEDLPVHTTEGTVVGRDPVMAFTDLAKRWYPGLQLRGDEVIWCGDEDVGFHSSHRLTHIGTNLGDSIYGAATGRSFEKRAVAHCVVRENFIVEEWVTRDELALIRSLGLDEEALAARLGTAEAAKRGGLLADVVDVPQPAQLDDPMTGSEDTIRQLFADLWADGGDDTERFFAADALIETATAKVIEGADGYRDFLADWRRDFSDVAILMEHMMSNRRAGGDVVATRWTLSGTHDGSHRFGAATGRRVRLMGFSHQLVADGKVVGEWTVFDEFSLLKQLRASNPTT